MSAFGAERTICKKLMSAKCHRQTCLYVFRFAIGFASSRALSIISWTTGLSARSFRVTIPLGRRAVARPTGKTLSAELLARNRSASSEICILRRRAATQQGAAALRGFNALPVAVKQPDAERMLKITDRSRNVRLSSIQDARRLPHAPGLRHRHEHMQILQLHSASDAVAQQHEATHFWFEMISSDNSLIQV